jgi:DNA-binding IclR family transcriptional regulator
MATEPSSTLAKGLQLLRAIVADAGRSSLSAIAAEAKIPLSTAHRLALTLEREGFLTRVRKGYFETGAILQPFLGERGCATTVAVRLRRKLARLASAFGAFAHFGVLEDGMVTYLVKEGDSRRSLFTAEAMQLEAYCSAIGKVLLAAQTRAELEEYLAGGPFVALTPHTIVEPALIAAEIEQVRAEAIAYDRHEIREDLFCVGVPVKVADGEVIGAVSLSFVGPVPESGILKRAVTQLKAIAASARAA